MFLQSIETQIAHILTDSPHVTEDNCDRLGSILTQETAVRILNELLTSPERLEKVSKQSYRHTLGFDKFILLDPGMMLENGLKGYGWQLRLHIWWPGTNRGVPVVESMHEHSFDFTSTVLAGEIENQRFTTRPLRTEEEAIAKKLQHILSGMTEAEKQDINNRLEALLALRLSEAGSCLVDVLGGADHLNLIANIAHLGTLLNMDKPELETILYLHDRFESVSSTLKKGEYIHQMTGQVILEPAYVQKISAGQNYFHPHRHIHRLINQDSLQATLLITTPVSQTAKGGSLQRPTYVAPNQNKNADVIYSRQMYTPMETAVIIGKFLKTLSL